MAVALDGSGASTHLASTPSATLSSLTVGSGSNRAIVVGIALQSVDAPSMTVIWDNAATGGSQQPMTIIGGPIQAGGSESRVYLWGLVNPNSGTRDLLVTTNTGNQGIAIGAQAFTGVDPTGGTTSFASFTSATQAGAHITMTGTANDWLIDAITNNAANIVTPTPQTQVTNGVDNTISPTIGMSQSIGGASVPFGWTTGTNWAQAGVIVKAVAGAAITLMGAICL